MGFPICRQIILYNVVKASDSYSQVNNQKFRRNFSYAQSGKPVAHLQKAIQCEKTGEATPSVINP